MEYIYEHGETFWILSGLVPYLILALSTKYEHYKEGKSYSIGEDPAAGQAFLISILLGPIMLVFLFVFAFFYLDKKFL